MQEARLLHSFSLDLRVQVSETFKDLTVADCITHSNKHARERTRLYPLIYRTWSREWPAAWPARLKYECCTMFTGVCLSVVASKMILSIPSLVMMYVTVAINVPGYPCTSQIRR